MFSLLLCLVPSAALFTLTIWPFGPPLPFVFTAVEATQGALFRLERWSEYWCFPVNSSTCEASFFKLNLDQAIHQSNLLLFNSRLRFNPTPTFLGITFDSIVFSKFVSSLKAKFSLISRPCAVSLISPGAPLRSTSLFCIKLFFSRFLHMPHPDSFLYLAFPT